jgi:NAD(P)-dependent dehydrogenase (short-subunit alcohol dehydrogenase family)
MSETGRVAIITGGSQGIGAGLVAGYLQRGWAVVASARTIKPSQRCDLLTVPGDITDPATADRIADAALDWFGRIDTLVNNAGVFVSKPFTDYTAEDYALLAGHHPDADVPGGKLRKARRPAAPARAGRPGRRRGGRHLVP